MKIKLVSLLMFLLCTNYADAQGKISIRKWVAQTVDSLQKKQVDTIEYYHAYCGECMIMNNPKENHRNYCETDDSWTQIESTIIYQQRSKYYSLTFNCSYPSIKKELAKAKSIPYFLSIIPVLNKRDKIIAIRRKNNRFQYPAIADGRYDELFIFYHKLKQSVHMHDDKKTYKGWSNYLWFDEQTKLLKLMLADMASNDVY